MAKKPNESFQEYRERVMDPISKSFCAAKWLNATIWLTGGKTTSCHHPPAHSCDLNEIEQNPSALHNTFRKRFARQLMLGGKRPKECDYCWQIEDLGDPSLISDRVYKTAIYTDEELVKLTQEDPMVPTFDLKTLEVSFNAECNLACCYCNPAFSSRWMSDIATNGEYQNLTHSDRQCFNHLGEDYRRYADSDDNPYIQAFWKWWPDLVPGLQDFRVTGGEPLLSPQLWKIFDSLSINQPDGLSFSINSNLSVSSKLIDKLIDSSKRIKNLHIYTSCEAFGAHAEYIRDGLRFSEFTQNCLRILREAKIESFNMMMTINCLNLFSMIDFLNLMVKWKREYGIRFPVWTVNILRFPCFLSCLTLPDYLRLKISNDLETWIHTHRESIYVTDLEVESITRLVEYLRNAPQVHPQAPTDRLVMQKDFKQFILQYDQRRHKNFRQTFPSTFVEWFDSIETGDEK